MGHSQRTPNISEQFISDISSSLKLIWSPSGIGDRLKTLGPEDIFYFSYAVMHSRGYRKRYGEFLKGQFPRIPLTTDHTLFWTLSDLGQELTSLHLMKQHAHLVTKYPIAGIDVVEEVRYVEPVQRATEGRIWINQTQYFEGVSPTLWDFRIGGYQVAGRWLSDRRRRKLSYDNLTYYQQVLAALSRTLDLISSIDHIVEMHGGWPLAGSSPAREALHR